jgi:hypothetical protein|nr:MAG TPA: hypothetical protein [Caudoviricetes sp.]
MDDALKPHAPDFSTEGIFYKLENPLELMLRRFCFYS